MHSAISIIFAARRLPDWRVLGGAVQGPARPRRQSIDSQEDDGPPRFARRIHIRQETHGLGHLNVYLANKLYFFNRPSLKNSLRVYLVNRLYLQ